MCRFVDIYLGEVQRVLAFLENVRFVRFELFLVGDVRLSVQRCAERRCFSAVDRLVPFASS